MIASSRMSKPVLAVILACGLSACAMFEPCNSPSCAEDAKLTDAVEAQFAARPALGVDRIYVQVADHVAYLNGLVDTDVERQMAEDVAAKVPGITRVVNKLRLLGNRM